MKRNKLSGILRRILLVIIALIIGIRVYVWNAQNLLGNQLPMPFGYGVAVVLSGSMEPEMSVDDLLIIKETNSYEVGDVVVYQSGQGYIVHRIVRIDGELVTTQGDANNAADEPIEFRDIKGEIIGNLPRAGVIVRALKTPVGILSVLALAVILIEFSYRREQEQEQDELEQIREEIRALKEEMEQ